MPDLDKVMTSASQNLRSKRLLALAMTFVFAIFAGAATATPIASWNFDDGTADDLLGNFDLGAVGGGPTIAGGIALFDGDDASPSYLEAAGFGGHPTWTVSMRIQASGPVDQGDFQGIFSNNNSPSADYSWQVENFGGVYQFRTTSDVYVIGAPTGGFDTIVVRKTSNSDGDLWFNGVQVVASFGSNPGGLQNFRVGTNRNSSRFYAFSADSIRVFDSVEDPLVVPEPSTTILLGIGLAGLGRKSSGPYGSSRGRLDQGSVPGRRSALRS